MFIVVIGYYPVNRPHSRRPASAWPERAQHEEYRTMPASQKKKRSRNCMTVNVPIPTRMQLDYLVGLLEEYRPQVEGLTFGKVTRSIVIRCAVAYFEHRRRPGMSAPRS